ncbi:hypothetical protein GF327_02315 [Candidatus Woesearchaeota archaeon]|nr:hypothetical protein [Candidatus Woesearchaeota archaeon]
MDPYNVLDFQGMLYKIPENKRKKKIRMLLELVELMGVEKKIIKDFSGGR